MEPIDEWTAGGHRRRSGRWGRTGNVRPRRTV